MDSPHPDSGTSVPPRHRSSPVDSGFRADAIERLHAVVLQVDTFARLASNAVDDFRFRFPPETERAFARLHILVTKVAEETHAALAEADQLVADLHAR